MFVIRTLVRGSTGAGGRHRCGSISVGSLNPGRRQKEGLLDPDFVLEGEGVALRDRAVGAHEQSLQLEGQSGFRRRHGLGAGGEAGLGLV